MTFCSTKPQESDRQKKINAYLQAVEVIKRLKADGKLDETCKVKAVPIPLYKNMVALVWGNSEVDFVATEKQVRKISLKRVIKN